jgi:hypothetical protein
MMPKNKKEDHRERPYEIVRFAYYEEGKKM